MAHSLETLPWEIQTLVLEELDSATSLFALLRASPLFLKVYRRRRVSIFTEIVCNSISSDLLPTALTSAKLRCINGKFGEAGFYSRAVPDEAWQTLTHITPPSVQQAKRMHQFESLAEKVIRDVSSSSFAFLDSQMTTDAWKTSLNSSLSPIEYTRIKRGLYNFELLSQMGKHYMYALLAVKGIERDKVYDIFNTFVQSLSLHEIEEVYYIIYYFRERLAHLLDTVEDDRCKHFVALGPQQRQSELHFEHDIYGSLFNIICNRSCQDRWLDTMLFGQGVQSLVKVLDSSTSTECINSIIATWHGMGAQMYKLIQTIQVQCELKTLEMRTEPSTTLRTIDYHSIEHVDKSTQPNLGLQWACRQGVPLRPQFSLVDDMVTSGLAIWDSNRLREMGMFKTEPRHMCRRQSFYSQRMKKPTVYDRARNEEGKWRAQGLL